MEIMKFLCFYEDVIKDFYLEFFEENIYKIFYCYFLRFWKIFWID